MSLPGFALRYKAITMSAVVLLMLYGAGCGVCLVNKTGPFPAAALVEGLRLVTRLYMWVPIVAGVALSPMHMTIGVKLKRHGI